MGKREDYGMAAEKLFIEANRTYEEISELLNVSRKTIAEWGKNGQWVLKKKKLRTSPHTIVERIETGIEQMLASGPMNPSTADAVTKLDKTLQRYLKKSEEHFLTKAIEVMDRFTERLQKKYKDPEKRRIFMDEIDEFFTDYETA